MADVDIQDFSGWFIKSLADFCHLYPQVGERKPALCKKSDYPETTIL
jgi:hypothetical protein